jgi:Flp pilus assembly protein TadG
MRRLAKSPASAINRRQTSGHSAHCQSEKPGFSRKRRGVLSMELAITLPIFGLLLMGLFEYSLLFASRGDVVEACRVGCRRGTLTYATAEEVEEVVRWSLGSTLGPHAIIESELGEYTGDEVVVTVRVPMSAASPDFLWPIGFGLRDRELSCQSRMVKE